MVSVVVKSASINEADRPTGDGNERMTTQRNRKIHKL